MAALLNRGDILEELKLDASDAPADVYARFVHRIIERSILPRKFLVQSSKGDFVMVAKLGRIVGFQTFKARSLSWVRSPMSEAKQHALELSVGEALKDGELSLSMINDLERVELAKREAPVAAAKSGFPKEPSEIVSLSDWKKGKNRNKSKAVVIDSTVLADFFTSIKSKVKFVYLEDTADEQVQTSGVSGVVDEAIASALTPSILKWREAVLPALGRGPQLLTMRSPSSGGTSLVCAVDGRQFLLAEFETRNLGVVAGLWIKASHSK